MTAPEIGNPDPTSGLEGLSALEIRTLMHLRAEHEKAVQEGRTYASEMQRLRDQADEEGAEAWERFVAEHELSETGDTLEAVKVTLERFVVFPNEHQAVAVAVWVMHTYVFTAFDTTPYLYVKSATKQSGKTRLFEVLSLLAARAWLVVEASEATLFRSIEKKQPTLLLDEIDAAFGKDAELTQGIRGVINAGYRKGATVPRCSGSGFEVVDFSVFCPKAFAGIGDKLPDTIVDRSIPIELRRRSKLERKPERFRQARAKAELEPLAARLRDWGKEYMELIATYEPELPDALSDRQQDAWEICFAIAALAGGAWPGRVEQAALALHEAHEDQDLTVQLLAHIREAFDDLGDRLSTIQLLEHLVNRGDASPWIRYWGDDVSRGGARLKSAGRGLARMLQPLGLGPSTLRLEDRTRKGYDRSQFEDSWARYLPSRNPEATRKHPRSEHLSPSALPDRENGPDQQCSVVTSATADDAGEYCIPTDADDPTEWLEDLNDEDCLFEVEP